MKAVEDALKRDQAVLQAAPGLAELLRARVDAATTRFEAASAEMARRVMQSGPAAPAAPAPAASGAAAPPAP
jgi:hypothetical protein